MSLDKWIKSDEKKKDKKSIKKKNSINNEKTIKNSEKNIETDKRLLKKFILNCSKKSCNYQKTVMKRNLRDKDLICPRCDGRMKVTEF